MGTHGGDIRLPRAKSKFVAQLAERCQECLARCHGGDCHDAPRENAQPRDRQAAAKVLSQNGQSFLQLFISRKAGIELAKWLAAAIKVRHQMRADLVMQQWLDSLGTKPQSAGNQQFSPRHHDPRGNVIAEFNRRAELRHLLVIEVNFIASKIDELPWCQAFAWGTVVVGQ